MWSCVCQQMLSPHNKGLLKRAISQSGVALCSWALNRNPLKVAEQVGPHLVFIVMVQQSRQDIKPETVEICACL